MPAAPGRGDRLARTLRAPDVLILTLSALSPAASVYVTGAAILHLAGTGAALALIVGAATISFASLLFAELGSAFPSAGGFYPGVRAVLGRSAGAVVIVLGLLNQPAFIAFAALGLADYLRVLAPMLPKLPLAFAMIGAAALLAIVNIRVGLWVTGIFFATELAALAVLCATGFLHPARGLGEVLLHPVMLGDHGRLSATPGWLLALAAASGAFACAGSNLAINFAEDLRDRPSRVGRIVVAGGAIASITVCLPIIAVVTSAPDLRTMLAADAPIAAFLSASAGPDVATAVTIAVALAIFNNIAASMMAFSRFFYAVARDKARAGGVVGRLGSLHARFGSPAYATAALAIIGGLACLVSQRRLLILLSGELFTATLVITAVFVGRLRHLTGVTSFRSPFFPVGPVIGLMIIVAFFTADWFDPAAGRPSMLLLGAIALVTYGGHRLLTRSRQERRAGPEGRSAASAEPASALAPDATQG